MFIFTRLLKSFITSCAMPSIHEFRIDLNVLKVLKDLKDLKVLFWVIYKIQFISRQA
jgi:hypothetical protein